METSQLKPTLSSLGAQVKELAETLERHLQENDVEMPTLAADSPVNISKFTAEIFTTKQKLADALNDLSIISQGPSESVFNYAHNAIPDVAVLNVLNHFNFWTAVPLDGSASIADIAHHTSLPEEVVQRVLDHGITLRFFAYTDPSSPKSSRIQHTSRTAALAKSSGLRALVNACIQECGPPMLVMPEALERYSLGKPKLTTDIGETAFALSHSGGEVFGKFSTVWDYMENDGAGERKGWRQRSFNEWMTYIKDIFGTEKILLDTLDWKEAGEATVVDIGGSGGHDVFALANAFPKLNVVVEDLHECKAVFDRNVPDHLKSRARFVEHNFFEPQPVKADVYILKMILHDWPDKECVEILQAVRPAMKAGAKILFIDYVGKHGDFDATLPRSMHQFGTSTDVRMMALFNGKERSLEAWKDMFHAADERFEVARVQANALTYMVVIEAIWRGD